jgi:5-methylcytosine-specific restriction endonuclease McrA
MVLKPCSKCQEAKPVTEFHKNGYAADGLRSACKACTAEINRASIRRHHDKRKAEKRAAYYAVRDTPEFQAKRKAHREATKAQKRAYDAERHRKNAEAIKARVRDWVAQNRDRRRTIVTNYDARRRAWAGSGVSTSELRAWLISQPKRCYWCGSDCAENRHIDHYVPLSKGGKHELANLVIACGPCNLRKNAKDPLDFAREVGRLL